MFSSFKFLSLSSHFNFQCLPPNFITFSKTLYFKSELPLEVTCNPTDGIAACGDGWALQRLRAGIEMTINLPGHPMSS